MMPSSSTSEKPSYSSVVALTQSTYRQSQMRTSTSTSSSTDSDNDSIADVKNLKEERFLVDRRKLEEMIKTESRIEGVNCAEAFFERIEKITNILIQWPHNLKIGARCRRDPHVGVTGRPDDTAWAKGLIWANLAPKGSLLKLKMTIYNTDHPSIIGRGGYNINRIMQQTETHIHFPDSNRKELEKKKNNQVAIYGSLNGLERARELLRLSEPLTLSFEVLRKPFPRRDEFIWKIENSLNVNVVFFETPKPECYLVCVKGTQQETDKIKEATHLLLKSLYGALAPHILVTIQLGMDEHFYSFIKGKVMDTIMEDTQTHITETYSNYLDPFDITPIPKMIITGSVDGICEAKKRVIKCLPIELIFEVTENLTNTSELMSLGSKYDIHIAIQQKLDNTIAVRLKGSEKIVNQLYKAHQEILDLQFVYKTESEIPKAYFLQEPAFLRLLENNINSDKNQYEIISSKIWIPKEPNCVNNFLPIERSHTPINICKFNENIVPLQVAIPLFEQQPVETEAIPSPDSTDSSEVAYHGGRRSSDWIVMEQVKRQPFEKDSPYRYFDSEDIKIAYILMSLATSETN